MLASNAHAQHRSFELELSGQDTALSLRADFVDSASVSVHDALTGATIPFGFHPESNRLLLELSGVHGPLRIRVGYFEIPLTFSKTHTLFDRVNPEIEDSASRKLPRPRQKEVPSYLARFEKSGSISRGIEAGSNREAGVTSGFNLQFSGDLAENVNVKGALTEETTPIQPEGNTQTLRDIDRIYVELNANDVLRATFGDFVVDYDRLALVPTQAIHGFFKGSNRDTSMLRTNSLTRFTRKLLGVEAALSLQGVAAKVSAASTKGQFTTNELQGQESFQGPYRLFGSNGERAIVVIAGSERVYVDGLLQTRGERNDYVIDYGLAEIRFQPRRPVSSTSRITVDFEYTDLRYSRSLYAARAEASALDGAIMVTSSYAAEGDNTDAGASFGLSDADRDVLRAAGRSDSLARRSGVSFAGLSASGKALGNYARRDTSIGGLLLPRYEYAPEDSVNALYNISFGYVGMHRGAYRRIGLGQFAFVGPLNGDYDTTVAIPIPRSNQVIGFGMTVSPLSTLRVTGEIAHSQFTPNRFASDIKDGDDAYKLGASFADTLNLFGLRHGSIGLEYMRRSIGERFVPLDRISDVELERRYGIERSRDDVGLQPTQSERIDEFSSIYSPTDAITLEGFAGWYSRGAAAYRARRTGLAIDMKEDSSVIPALHAHLERVPTFDALRGLDVQWSRERLELGRNIRSSGMTIRPRLRYFREQKDATVSSTHALDSSSFESSLVAPGFDWRLSRPLVLNGEYEIRADDSVVAGTVTRIANARTLRAGGVLSGMGGFHSTLDMTYRSKSFVDSASRARAGGDINSLLVRLEPRYANPRIGVAADALYEISSQRSSRIERIFYQVPKGQGSYRYIGDLNSNGRPDQTEFAPIRYADEGEYILLTLPTEQLFPTSDLRTSVRLRIQPGHWASDSSVANRLLGLFSAESFLKLEETSKSEDQKGLFLFNTDRLQEDSATLKGLIEFEQLVNLLEESPTQSFRLRFYQRNGAIDVLTGLERTYLADRSIRGRFRPLREFANETTVGTMTDISSSSGLSFIRPHHTSIWYAATDFSYHPDRSRFDMGIKLEAGKAIERSSTPTSSGWNNSVLVRGNYSLENSGRIRAELERSELIVRGFGEDQFGIPYAVTGGRALGVTWLWRASVDQTLTDGIVLTLSYDGRNSAPGPLGNERLTVHNGRAEVRATF